MKRKEAIKRTREGVIQVFNDYHPSTKEIKKFLKEAFPNNNNDQSILKNHKYIVKNTSVSGNYAMRIEKKENLQIIDISTITKRKKTKLKQLEKQFSDLAKDVSELRQTLAKDVEVDAEEVKSELIVGEWYKWKYPTANLIFRITKIGRIYIYYYGIDDGEWSERFIDKDNDFEKATPQEVQTALENEAKKRGFKNGSIINNSSIGFGFNELCLETNIFEWDGTYLNIGKEKLAIFKDGIWAEIQQETIKEEEIDFSVPQLLISIYNDNTVYFYKAECEDRKITVYPVTNILQTGVSCHDQQPKSIFKTFKGELTIK